MIGAPISVAIYLLMMTQLDKEALITGVIWCVLGLIIYSICRIKYQDDTTEENEVAFQMEAPGAEEKKKMDREFKIWRNVVAIAVILVLLAYGIAYIL